VKAPDGAAVGWAKRRMSPAGSAEYDSRVAAGLADAPIGFESVPGETGLTMHRRFRCCSPCGFEICRRVANTRLRNEHAEGV
jgi:hypothetical protein